MAAASPMRPDGGALNYQHPLVFKSFIIKFVKSLLKDDRAYFRYWCLDIIPRAKLDISVDDDGDILKLIEFLQNDNKLSFTDMSFLKEFLTAIDRIDLLEMLKQVELRIAVGIILEYLSLNVQQGSYNACNLHEDIIEFLVTSKDKNQELISQAVELLKLLDDKSVILEALDDMNQERQQSPQSFWSTLAALLVILGELYSSISSDSAVNINEFLAEWMLKNGGLVSTHLNVHVHVTLVITFDQSNTLWV